MEIPQLYERPSSETLIAALEDLKLSPRVWNHRRRRSEAARKEQKSAAAAARLRHEESAFLSSIIKSTLHWIGDPDAQDGIWTLAAKRITERCGRAAMGDMTRTWPLLDSADPASERSTMFHLTICEPALTGDALGHKTWGSSYLLAQQLPRLASTVLFQLFDESLGHPRPRVLELGSGTGLLGIAAASLWRVRIVLTDVAEIVPNLSFNAARNRAVVEERGGGLEVGVLEWGGHVDESVARRGDAGSTEGDIMDSDREAGSACDAGGYEIVLVADGLYTDDGPKLLASAIAEHLAPGVQSRVVAMAPQRDANAGKLLEAFRRFMDSGPHALACIEEEWLTVEDDWEGGDVCDGENEEQKVACWLGVFARKMG